MEGFYPLLVSSLLHHIKLGKKTSISLAIQICTEYVATFFLPYLFFPYALTSDPR